MIAPTLALTLLLTSPAGVTGDWIESFDEGVELARREKKDLLIDFTGSDWCKWCQKLDVEVLRYPEFLEAVKAQYVLIRLDLPRRKDALERVPDIARNRELAVEFQVTTYPTLLLMTPDLDVWGRTGYREGGAAHYLRHLGKLRERGRAPLMEAIEIATAFAEAEGPERAALCERAVTLLATLGQRNAGAARLVPAVEHALEIDPENGRGLLARALMALYATRHATLDHVEKGKAIDPKNEAGLYELAVLGEIFTVHTERAVRATCASIDRLDALGPVKDEATAWLIYSNAATWQDRFVRDPRAAKKYARKALATGGGNPQSRGRMQVLANQRS